ncbi:MAG TPA: hemolysin family protein, partial [Vicinamibacteria bacterium]
MIALQIVLLAFLIVASMSLAAVEAAFYLIKRRRVAHLALENPRAELVNAYLEDPPALLMPVHIGTYTAHVGMTIIMAGLFLDLLAHWAMLVAFGAMVVYLLLFRLTVPYALVRSNPERSLLVLLPGFDLYARVLHPLVAALRRRGANEPLTVPPESVKPEVRVAPVLDPDEGRLVAAVARFAQTLVREVMTPRPDVVAISKDASMADLRRTLRDTKHSRIPVFGENLDDIVGVVSVRDAVEHDGPPEDPITPLVRAAFLVPETKKIADLMKEMQQQRLTFAVAIDEYGGTAGLVSVEDIVEELVGEIKDEYDVESEPIVLETDGSVVVAGRVAVDRLEEALATDLIQAQGVETVGGFVTNVFGHIPRAGEKTERSGFAIEVLDA